MAIVPNRDTPENREFWDFVEATAKEVRQWPDWMRCESLPRLFSDIKESPIAEQVEPD